MLRGSWGVEVYFDAHLVSASSHSKNTLQPRHYLHQRTFLFFSCKSSAVMENLSNKFSFHSIHETILSVFKHCTICTNCLDGPGEATVRGSGGSQVARAPVSLLEHQLQIARHVSPFKLPLKPGVMILILQSNQRDLRSAMCF